MKNFYLLLLLSLFSATAVVAQDVANSVQMEIDGIWYFLDSPKAGEATVTNKSGGGGGANGEYSGEIVIPEKVVYEGKEYTVTTIGNSAFKKATITAITIPATVTLFEDQTLFNCEELRLITCYAIEPPLLSSHPFKGMDVEAITLVIPGQSIDKYNDPDIEWSKFLYNPIDTDQSGGGSGNTYVKTSYIIYDSQREFVEVAKDEQTPDYNLYNGLEYFRDFRNANWQALYIPFSMNYDDWAKDENGNGVPDYEVARITGIYEVSTDIDDIFYLMGDVLGEGSVVEAHTFYLIKAEAATSAVFTTSVYKGEVDKDNDPLTRVYTSNVDKQQTFYGPLSGSEYTIKGRYAATAEGAGLRENYPDTPYYYAMSGGMLKRPNPDADAGIPLGAFRWWLEVAPVGNSMVFGSGRVDASAGNDNDAGSTSAGKVVVDVQDIDGLGVFYDLGGRRVENPSNGVYILNGKKIYIK